MIYSNMSKILMSTPFIKDTFLSCRVFDSNVRSVYHLTMLAVPHLIKSKGNIVNVSSVAGMKSFPGVLAYCMSKASIEQMTRCTALELSSKQVCITPQK